MKLFYRNGPYSKEIMLLKVPEGHCQDATQCTLSEFEK